MVSACLNGQTGPHRDYPGFGGQGSALAGYNYAHRLARPRARRPARHDHRLARAALRRHRARGRPALPPPHRTRRVPRRVAGRGGDLLALPVAARLPGDGRGAGRVPATPTTARVVHGVFACADETDGGKPIGDRWVAVAAWTEAEHDRLDGDHRRRPGCVHGRPHAASRSRRSSRPPASRPCRSRTSATSTPIRRSRTASTSSPLTHPFLGDGLYERNGFRLSDGAQRLRPRRADPRPGPGLGARRAARPRRRTSGPRSLPTASSTEHRNLTSRFMNGA